MAAYASAVMAAMPTTEGDLTSAVPANTEQAVDLRVTNISAVTVKVRVGINDGTNTFYAAYDYELAAGKSIDVLRGFPLPTGWKLRHKTDLTGVHSIVTVVSRSTL